MRVIICITGASGTVYALRLIEKLHASMKSHGGVGIGRTVRKPIEIDVVASSHGIDVMKEETDKTEEYLKRLGSRYYDNSEINCDIASGSTYFDSVVIVPCSMNSLSKISAGISDNLITRVAAVALKEKRKLIIVPRETPLSTIHLRNMAALSACGAVIFPPVPAFYKKPKTIEDIVNCTVDRILTLLEHK